MISFILLTWDDKEIERVGQNENYYVSKPWGDPDFPILSQVDDGSPTLFARAEMAPLENELRVVREELLDEAPKKHIDDILRLVEKAKLGEGGFIYVTPYGAVTHFTEG